MKVLSLILAAALVSCSNSPEPAPPQASTQGSTNQAAKVKLKRMVSVNSPIAFAVRAGDRDAYYIAERAGRVRRFVGTRSAGLVLDIRSMVTTDGEGGLLGIAFALDGSRLYVNYTDTSGDTRIAWFAMEGNQAVRSSRIELLKIDQPYSNHNGGDIHIGPDGMLYIAVGDGGAGGDPHGHGQNRNTLLGSILRIDPNGDPYNIPDDNPFVGIADRREEILHYGLRNPWRMHIDAATNTLFVADVGQNAWEEVTRVSLGKTGANLGWARMEGKHTYDGATAPSNHHKPIFEYSRSAGRCAITGGVVMRDRRLPAYEGRYLYVDLCAGPIRSLKKTSTGWRSSSMGISASTIVSFGVHRNGRVFVLSLNGNVYRIDPA